MKWETVDSAIVTLSVIRVLLTFHNRFYLNKKKKKRKILIAVLKVLLFISELLQKIIMKEFPFIHDKISHFNPRRECAILLYNTHNKRRTMTKNMTIICFFIILGANNNNKVVALWHYWHFATTSSFEQTTSLTCNNKYPYSTPPRLLLKLVNDFCWQVKWSHCKYYNSAKRHDLNGRTGCVLLSTAHAPRHAQPLHYNQTHSLPSYFNFFYTTTTILSAHKHARLSLLDFQNRWRGQNSSMSMPKKKKNRCFPPAGHQQRRNSREHSRHEGLKNFQSISPDSRTRYSRCFFFTTTTIASIAIWWNWLFIAKNTREQRENI